MKLWMLAARAADSISAWRRIRFGICQVGADGVVEEIILLRHHADRGRKRVERHVAQVMPVDADDALGGVIQAWDEIGHRGFASAGGADQRDQLSGTRGKGDCPPKRPPAPGMWTQISAESEPIYFILTIDH